LLDGYARRKTPDASDTKTCRPARQQRIAPLSDWHIHIDGTKTSEEIEGGRNNSDDRVVFAFERDGLTQNLVRRTKFAFPESGGQHHRWGSSDSDFIFSKGATEGWVHSELLKESRTQKDCVDLLRFADSREN
jgi:hypothetical protein